MKVIPSSVSSIIFLFLLLGTTFGQKADLGNGAPVAPVDDKLTNQIKQISPSLYSSPLTDDGFVTQPKKSFVSGIRVEPEAIVGVSDPAKNGVAGYIGSGISLVIPNIRVRVVLFGWWLDELEEVAFTSNENCSSSSIIIPVDDFTIMTSKRVVIETRFLEEKALYKICIKQKARSIPNPPKMSYVIIDDTHTFLSTNIPSRKYYLPFSLQIIIISIFLVLSGLFSGLNLGLMSLTPQELMLIQKSGSQTERKYAEAIIPIRKSGNLLLCSLLIGNVCVNSAISILMDDLTSGVVALIASSAGIVVFGEIFPQSLCVKKGLAVGARTIWITRFFMMLTFPLAYPISRALDCILGDEVVSYDRKRLMELIKLTTRNEAGLAEELKIAVGAMEISDKTVNDVMTKIEDVFMLPDTTILNAKTVTEILNMGYTRIPIYSGNDRHNVVSLLFVKDLALMDPDDNFTVKTVCAYNEHVLRFVMEDTPLRVMLEEFKKGDYHLAMVQRVRQKDDADPVYELSGLVTLEDIVEEILQAEIVDETDVITDNVHKIRRRKTKTKDLTNCFIDNDSLEVISMQLHLVALQFLSANHPAFYSDRINQNVLTKLIKQNTHKIDLSNIQDASTIRLVSAPRNARLYTKKEGSDRFILILEGRVIVTIGNDNMTFEAGPWHSFGKEVLDKLVEICLPVNNEIKPIENKDVKEEANGGSKKVERVKSVASIDSPAHSQTLVTCATSSGITQAMGSDQKRFVTFFPDYSAIVRENCTYLEISAQAYLVAYKTSLIHRVGPNTEEKIVEPFKRSSLQNIPANIGSLAASNASLNIMERQNLINEKGVSSEKLSNGILGSISPLLQNGKKPIPFFKGSATSLSDEAHIPLIGLDNKKKG